MPKYAYFDSTQPVPQPVLGWYDTDELDYPNLPAAADLLEITQAVWDNRASTPYVDAGGLIPTPVVVPPPPTLAELTAIYNKAVEVFIIQKAQSKGYRDDVACVGYRDDPYAPFANDALSFIAWRSQVWQRCYSDLGFIKEGSMQVPASTDAYIATLPQSPVGW